MTTSPGAILIQGFFEKDVLNQIRDGLRHQLRSMGLGDGLDGRYRLETAHLTAVRFRAPLRQGAALAAALEEARDLPLGRTRVATLRLVEHDWYMTQRTRKVIKTYSLQTAQRLNASSL